MHYMSQNKMRNVRVTQQYKDFTQYYEDCLALHVIIGGKEREGKQIT